MQQPGASQHRVASRCTEVGDLGFEPRLTESESEQLATEDHTSKQLIAFPPASCTTGRTRKRSEVDAEDAELAAIVAAWPQLPESLRSAILAIVATAKR